MRDLVLFLLLSRIACAQVTQHVTDLSIFSLLAPCASSAIANEVNTLTASTAIGCGTADPELQSCICSQSDVSSQVTKNVSEAVQSRCGQSATDDLWSASEVMRKFCNPGEAVILPTPTTNTVTQFITDMDKMSFLPPCVYSGISWVVMFSASSHCPRSASLYAPCVCSKSDVVDLVRSNLTSRILDRCDNREDVELADQVYSEYCAMNNGTTAFAAVAMPPGDMTYHITALSQYSSLPECAREAVSSAVIDQTSWNCAAGPQAIASCVCIKEGMLHKVYESMTARAGINCGFTNKEPVYSAIDVLNYYCSAAENKVVALVTDTATQLYPTASEGGGAGADGARQTGGNSENGDQGESDSAVGPGVIAGAVVGGVVGLAAIIGAVVWFVRRRRRAHDAGMVVVAPPGDYLKPELDGSGQNAPRAELGALASSFTPTQKSLSPGQEIGGSELLGTTVVSAGWHGPPAELSGDTYEGRRL
ncbi:uncharacterized protein VDAG_02880 [Verticillium dahliae VdLs.17]|uniref:Extracellular membrane protein CFEM domain-containing protein n=2 Tax=Verticillium dahliae TaxID=27337 RepID=G2WXA1_VERDV|nr:uncharacterized protein VDAG_02880 [Verticillium dahliae VdLs.17]KAH6707354.1 hypothetical protein EV126DRAFT_439551 [Verticillium dahliae]EGY21356.1 hypothetical protein VDAG_02880 [Verticillium dahliae VdLs.17]PNH30420.1 hypothetical protein BJF96_g6391 [Verticillium dahliae]PNH56448.1 hypothetical protein VD0003_g1289 [Verticillium dahliae]RXG43819.1 hypothetical protein VDGE_02880 [Verticillium dahliae]